MNLRNLNNDNKNIENSGLILLKDNHELDHLRASNKGIIMSSQNPESRLSAIGI